MEVRFKGFVSALILASTATLIAIRATAQERPVVFIPRTAIPSEMDETFGLNSFRNPLKSLEDLVGIAGFPETLIAGDGYRVHKLYQDLLTQQTVYDPMVRTADLPNPYTSSLLLSPNIVGSSRVTGSDLIFEKERIPQAQPPVVSPPPAIPQPRSQEPSGGIRSLF
jgi:hypothetical protein